MSKERAEDVHYGGGLQDLSAPRCLTFMVRGSTADLFSGRPRGADAADIMVKALRPEAARHPRRRYRFACECAVLEQVDHPGLPRLEMARPQPCQGAYLVYRYIGGFTLRDVLSSSEPLSGPQRVALAERVLRDIPAALGHLQALPGCYAHGDIAPRNIIVGPSRLSLIDLGIARPTESVASEGDLFTIAQPAYLSPEQAQGKPWDGCSDYYQIGLVLYEIMTGRRYNQGHSLSECRLDAAGCVERHGVWSAMPPAFQKLIHALLDPVPERRPKIDRVHSGTEMRKSVDVTV